jgi:hypothetical protein
MDDTSVMRMLIVSTGWGFGIVLLGLYRVTGLKHYLWFGLIGGVASTAIAFIPLTYGRAALAWGMVWGIVLCSSGVVLLRKKLRTLWSVAHDG